MCVICDKIDLAKDNKLPHLIHEFEHSFFIVGEHQYFPGYTQLLFKKHECDLASLDTKIQTEYFNEIMTAAKVIQQIYRPFRMNYSCLGNVAPHIHFHIFPRYKEELDQAEQKDPWFKSHKFDSHQVSTEEIVNISIKIKKRLDEKN